MVPAATAAGVERRLGGELGAPAGVDAFVRVLGADYSVPPAFVGRRIAIGRPASPLLVSVSNRKEDVLGPSQEYDDAQCSEPPEKDADSVAVAIDRCEASEYGTA